MENVIPTSPQQQVSGRWKLSYFVGLLMLASLASCSESDRDLTAEDSLIGAWEFVDSIPPDQLEHLSVMDSPGVDGEEYLRLRVKSGDGTTDKFAVASDGDMLTLGQAAILFAREHREIWGSLSLESAWLLHAATNSPVSKSFEVLVFPETETPASAVSGKLISMGLSATVRQSPVEMVIVNAASREQSLTIGRIGGVSRTVVAEAGAQVVPTLDVEDRTSAHYSNSNDPDAFVNLDNERCVFYGEEVPVGIMEPGTNSTTQGEGCGIWDAHESAGFTPSFSYQYALSSCQAPIPGGTTVCDDFCDDGLCKQMADGTSKCVERHASHVFSRISSSRDGQPLHAAKAPIYFAQLPPQTFYTTLVDSMDWFVSNDVRLINESFHLASAWQEVNPEGVINDLYARAHDITAIKSAGNQSGGALCRGRTELCVGRTFAACHEAAPCGPNNTCPQGLNCLNISGNKVSGSGVGRCSCSGNNECTSNQCVPDPESFNGQRSVCNCDYNQYFQDYQSYLDDFLWMSPTYIAGNGSGVLDVQVPDLLAEGQHAWAMDVDASITTSWRQVSGSSFSAPVVTGLAALMHQKRPGLSHLSTRALVRHSASPHHNVRDSAGNIDHLYPFGPTPSTWPAGTGMADGRILSWMAGPRCGEEPGGPTNRSDGEDAHEDGVPWDPVPEWAGTPPVDWNSDSDDVQTYRMPLKPNRTWKAIYTPTYPSDHDPVRIRATLAFLSCVTGSPEEVTTLPPAIDFDLHLCSEEAETCFGESEYIDDVDEGFDITVPEGMPGDTTIYVSKPPDSQACGSAIEEGREPFAWAASWVSSNQ